MYILLSDFSIWPTVPLRRLFSVVNGGTPSADTSNWDGGITWVTPEDLGKVQNKLIRQTRRSLTTAGIANSSARVVPPGSIVLSTRAPIGHVAIADVPLATNQGCRALVARESADQRYYYYHLLAAKDDLKALGQGTTFSELSGSELANYKLCCPPLPEQRAIAAYLDRETARIDALVEKKQRLIELLEERRAACIHHATTKGIDEETAFRHTDIQWLGDVPAHWEVKKIRRLALVKRGASPRPIDNPIYFNDQGEYAWVRISDVSANGKYLQVTEQRLSPLGQSKSVTLQPGNLFVSIAGSVGKPIISGINCCIHDGFVYFDGLRESPDYLYYLFAAGQLYKGLGKLGTQLNLNTDTIGSIHIPVPSADTQKRIVQFLDRTTTELDRLASTVEAHIATLQERRAALITAAVTGQIDVSRETA